MIGAGTLWLAAVMVANTLIGLYYYLAVGAKMYLREPRERGERIAVPFALVMAIILMVVIVAAVTVYPDFFNHFSPRSTLVAF